MSFDKVKTLDLNWKQDMLREYMTEEKKKTQEHIQSTKVFCICEFRICRFQSLIFVNAKKLI